MIPINAVYHNWGQIQHIGSEEVVEVGSYTIVKEYNIDSIENSFFSTANLWILELMLDSHDSFLCEKKADKLLCILKD